MLVCGSSRKEHKGGENPPGGARPVASAVEWASCPFQRVFAAKNAKTAKGGTRPVASILRVNIPPHTSFDTRQPPLGRDEARPSLNGLKTNGFESFAVSALSVTKSEDW